MMEWIISGNPLKYDVVGAFHELKKIDWKQSANISAGDVVYIYVSGNIKAIRFKCCANKVDIKVPDIDDQKFNISGEFDGHAGRYMELELIEEFSGSAYTREELKKHGFHSPMGQVRMPESVKNYLLSLSAKPHTVKKLKSDTTEFDKNMILYGPPGTGKTYSSAIYAVAICDEKELENVRNWDYDDVMSRYHELQKEGRVTFTTFHQSYGYEEFIEGIKPVMDNDEESSTGGDIKYDVFDGVFKAFCKKARAAARVPDMSAADAIAFAKRINPSSQDLADTAVAENKKPCVFIIDEINRGNISKIFGELITLIEDTKREGMNKCIPATLPYSGDEFAVPQNVYILGTMNTADRSIALMDTALRRRFRFVEMMPDADVLRTIGADKVQDFDVAAMLEKINERITFLYDREHTIGHAFFTKLKNSPNIKTLSVIFRNSIIPLLQEYFYEDYQKIQLVLGDNGKTDSTHKFILDEEVKVKSIFKGNADDVMDLPEKKYTINEKAFEILDAYKEII